MCYISSFYSIDLTCHWFSDIDQCDFQLSSSTFQVEAGRKMIPGESYFMIKIPTSAFFISKEGGEKDRCNLTRIHTFFFFLNKQSKEKLF